MEIVLKGVISGLVLALLVGPVFFTLLQTSIERGFLSGVWVAVGISLSDTLYITLSYLGLSRFFANPQVQIYLSYGGGFILFCFGVYYLLIKSKRLTNFNLEHIEERSPFRLMGKGFIMNGLSPMVLIFWIGTVGIATTDFGYSTPGTAIIFFGSIVCTVFCTDIIKAKLADKLRALLTTRLIRLMNFVLGIVLVIFGGKLIFFANQGNLF
jgi:threonine/homoserine/homoserine lactone efflux protein